jgi:hypothetical protein
MPVIWRDPKVWEAGPLPAADLNDYVSDLLQFLKTPPQSIYNPTTTFVTTSTSWISSGWSVTLETYGGPLYVVGHWMQLAATGTYVYYDIDVDGARDANAYGWAEFLNYQASGANYQYVPFFIELPSVAAGNHTFTLWVKNGAAGTLTLYGGTTYCKSRFSVLEGL